ncbi:hypothetical protein PT974_11243 [Cladobotryum mycophilum]|uniref:Uncharacterized protein n=1 Tax=Cladobotryum mycophilum TaxID=491253 RepID=A0ABR0S5P0_9HYPO
MKKLPQGLTKQQGQRLKVEGNRWRGMMENENQVDMSEQPKGSGNGEGGRNAKKIKAVWGAWEECTGTNVV